jgi:hypothetical protein
VPLLPEQLHIPPPTPDPRRLLTQANARQTKVDSLPDGDILEFWNSLESSFAMPDEPGVILARPVSARVALFDPPRLIDDIGEPFREEDPLLTQSMPVVTPLTRKTVLSSSSRPVTVKATPDIVNFGRIPEDTHAKASMAISNIGNKPWHFAACQPGDRRFKVLPARGMVYPGFSANIEILFLGGPPEIVTSNFTLTVKEPTGPITQLKIPVSVQVDQASRRVTPDDPPSAVAHPE